MKKKKTAKKQYKPKKSMKSILAKSLIISFVVLLVLSGLLTAVIGFSV
ncbi:hypothetical protein bcgnr5390_17250 [Bacillus luti]|nr:hypothetical protein BC2903_54510 [Bacillus cereus]